MNKKILKPIDNPCANNPCLNGGTCQTTGSSYTCQCAQFYSGTNCQICIIWAKTFEILIGF